MGEAPRSATGQSSVVFVAALVRGVVEAIVARACPLVLITAGALDGPVVIPVAVTAGALDGAVVIPVAVAKAVVVGASALVAIAAAAIDGAVMISIAVAA